MHPERGEILQPEKENRKSAREAVVAALEAIEGRKVQRLKDAEREPKKGGWKDRETRVLLARLANAGDELIEFNRLSDRYGWLAMYEAEIIVGRRQPKSPEAREKIFQAKKVKDELFLKRERHGELKRRWMRYGDGALTPEEDRELDEFEGVAQELQAEYDRLVDEAMELEHKVWVEKNAKNPELQMVVEEMESAYAREAAAAEKRLKELQVMGMGPEILVSPEYAEFLGDEYEKAIRQAERAKQNYEKMQAAIIRDYGRDAYEAVKKSLRRL